MKLPRKSHLVIVSWTLFGAAVLALQLFGLLHMRSWNPTCHDISWIAGAIASFNIIGIAVLAQNHAACGPCLLTCGMVGNSVSLLLITTVTAAYVFQEICFHI